MKKTILQTHIDLLNECKRQNKMLEKLIELNMNDLHEIADQRDWYYERCMQLKDKINTFELKVHVLEVANDDLAVGHNRYEKLRRLSPMRFHELYEKNLKTGEHFDILVDKL